jgi:hypothetical protein
MLKTTLYIFTLVVLFGTGCQPTQDKGATENDSVDTTVTEETESTTLDGYWILTDYIDSIFKDQAIGKHRLCYITWSAMSLNIQKDSLFSTGLLFIEKKIKINPDSDTLGSIEDFGTFVFHYNKETDRIEATDIQPEKNNKFKDKKYIYRRVTEKRLIDILDKKDGFKIRDGFYQLFIDSLIAGEYKSVDNGQKVNLTTNGLMTGFKKYNKYHIHDYFGTSHPFQNYDVICFEDTTVVSPGNAPPPKTQICYYNWTFSGDTLTLTEMLTDNYDEYFLGKQIYRFIRTKKHNH